MKKLGKYLKPFWISIILSIALLFGQAIADLNLPNFMSDIVNVGIQQGGIENGSPQAISEKGYSFMTFFMSDKDKALTDSLYMQVKGSDLDKDGVAYSKTYPLSASERIYVLKDTDSETRVSLDNAFGLSSWTFINIIRDMQAAQSGTSDAPKVEEKISLEKLYGILPMISSMPPQILEQAYEKALATDPSMLPQTATTFASLFYEELGLSPTGMQTKYIVKIGIFMLAIALLGGLATVSVSFLSSRISAGVARNLRRDVFNKVESFSQNEFDNFSTASLITRTTNDITQVQQLVMMGLRMICYAPIMGIGGVIMALNKSPSMSWIIALGCVMLILLMLIIFIVAMPKFKSIQKLIDKLNLVAREGLSGLMVIRAFGNEKFEENRFDNANKDLAKTNLYVNRVVMSMMPAMTLIMNGVTLLVIWVGAHNIAASTIQVGDMMAFMQYAMQIIMSFLMISMMFIMVPRAAVSAERIAEILNTEPTVKDPTDTKPLRSSSNDMRGYVEFKNVSFGYPEADAPVLENISFIARPGETTAFIGSTGSGKSTLINLIPRFYDVTAGQVLVNGVDVRHASQHELRECIGYVPQKGVLLSGTIESNLKYGQSEADNSFMEKCATVAQSMPFINERGDKFQSAISQGGTNVSGGQKQRLSIARALVKDPDVYIFDDSFSALDFKTDATLRKALKEHTTTGTVIVVAQRVSTIMNAEQIIVLDEGRIVGTGTHSQLLKSCPEYLEIASSQLSKEELA